MLRVRPSFKNKIFLASEIVTRRCSAKKVLLKILQNLQENDCVTVSSLKKLQVKANKFIKKETLTQVLLCEFCDIFKNTVSYRTPLLAASVALGSISKN